MLKNAFVLVMLFGCGGSPKQQTAPPHPASEEPAPVDPAQQQAQRDAETKAAAAVEARAKVDAIEKSLLDITAKVDAAVEDLNNIENDAERARARDALEALRKEKTQLEAQIAHAKSECDRAERAELRARSR